MITFYFGDRVIGTLTLEQGEGIGAVLHERGLDVLGENKHYLPADGEPFLDAVQHEFGNHSSASMNYFRAERT